MAEKIGCFSGKRQKNNYFAAFGTVKKTFCGFPEKQCQIQNHLTSEKLIIDLNTTMRNYIILRDKCNILNVEFRISIIVRFSAMFFLNHGQPVVSDGGNRSSRRKPPPNRKLLANAPAGIRT